MAHMPMFTEQSFPVGPHALNAAIGPDHGPLVVLLHGVVRRWQDFAPVLTSLAGRNRVIAVDHRGHGGSARADRYLVADYIADAAALVGSLEAPAVVIGHSLGALVALGVAAAVPGKVRAIVLEDPPSANFLARIDDTPYAAQWRAMQSLCGRSRTMRDVALALAEVRLPGGLRMGDLRDAASLRFLARCLRDLDAAVLTPVLEKRWLDGFDPVVAAAQVRCPALVLVGDVAVGGMLPPDDAAALEGALADPVRVNLPAVGHQIHALCPELYLRTTSNFLESLETLP